MMQLNNNTRLYKTPWGISSQPKKVVSIPVHYVGSHSNSDSERTRNNSAMKIQKVVRGFLVRNSMRKIKGIRVEVEEIENKVYDPETKELIKREQKERGKVNESIMNLLLKLDSIRVLNYYSGVRDFRKSVIRKAIALQEIVDQIQIVDPTCQDQPQLPQAEEGEEKNKIVDPTYQDQPQLTEAEEEEEKEKEKEDGEDVGEESVGTSIVEENCLVKEEEEEVESCKDWRGEEGDDDDGDDDNKNKSREMLEKMMEDSERMMGMMAQLFERNEKQIKLLTSLTHRVEQLERAYACDKLRKKNKKRRNNADAKHIQNH